MLSERRWSDENGVMTTSFAIDNVPFAADVNDEKVDGEGAYSELSFLDMAPVVAVGREGLVG